MISKQQLPEILLKACPSFQIVYDAYDEEEKEMYYSIAGDLAHHTLELFKKGDTSEFPEIAEAIEQFHVDGDQFVSELATIGFLEGIQNVWGHSDIDPAEMVPFLHPVSLKYWNSLNKFWQGEIPCVGADVSENPEQLIISDKPVKKIFARMPSTWTIIYILIVFYLIAAQIF